MTQQTNALSYQDLLALADEAAELSSVDMSEVSSGPQKRLLPAGKAIATLVEYVELGEHYGEYNGKPKTKPDKLFRLGFALSSPAAYLNEDGSPYIFRTFDLSLGNNEKAKAKIAFDRMNYLQIAKHFAQLLGKSFLVEIAVGKSKKTQKEFNSLVYATIDKPFEPMSGAAYPTPDINTLPFKLFLWDKPTQAGWDSLFIDGTHTDDKGVVTSKNYIQDTCRKASNFPGSLLEQLIGGAIPDITAPASLEPTAPASLELPATPVINTATLAALPTPSLTPEVAQPAATVVAPVVAPVLAAIPTLTPLV